MEQQLAAMVEGQPIPTRTELFIDFGMNVDEATHQPRIYQGTTASLRVEPNFNPDTVVALKAKGHRITSDETMGSAQSIMIANGLFLGIGPCKTEQEMFDVCVKAYNDDGQNGVERVTENGNLLWLLRHLDQYYQPPSNSQALNGQLDLSPTSANTDDATPPPKSSLSEKE